MTELQAWDDPAPMYRPNWRDRRDAREATARVEAFTHAGLVHYRDQYGQIGRHRPADPKCPCNPTKEKP